MRVRPNAHLTIKEPPRQPSDLYRRFRRPFEAVVAQENPAIARHELKDWYVSMPEVETALNEIVAGEIDSLRFLLGSTGIGKSTTLRYVFEAAQEPRITNDYLLVPLCFNSRIPAIDIFRPVARSASRHLAESLRIPFDRQGLYDAIKRTRPDLLELDKTVPETASDLDRLAAFKTAQETHYELEKLKWLLSKSGLKRVLLVVDDIESLPFETIEELLLDVCRAYSHLQNQVPRRFAVHCIISCRPSTHALLQKEQWYGVYSFDEPIFLNTAVSLEKLFRVRFHSALKNLDLVSNRDEWQKAYDILLRVTTHLADKYNLDLTYLCNNNVRNALREFKELLANRRWLQKDMIVTPSFALREEDYAVNEAAVYRALALRNGSVYPAKDTVIVNLFHNTPDEGSDLLVTYVIRYLVHHRLAGDTLGEAQVDKAVLCNDLAILFPGIVGPKLIDECIHYMMEKRLADTDQVRGRDIVVLTLRAQTLWRSLRGTSICLSFFRDDTYHDEAPYQPLSPVDYRHEDQTFADIFGFLTQIVAAERLRVENAIKYKLLPDYVARFGQQTLSRHLIEGIGHSLGSFYHRQRNPPAAIAGIWKLVDADIKELEALIDRFMRRTG
jgi:hypothetical protein